MNKVIKKYSMDAGKEESYEVIHKEEDVVVKGDTLTVKHEYYKRISDDELFEPFDNPDKNLEIDYSMYKEKHNLLSSNMIKAIRNKYNLNIRDFSSILGISYSNLSAIENGTIQSKYIDSLIRLAEDAYAFKNLIKYRKADIPKPVFLELMDTLNILITTSYSEHESVAKQYLTYQSEIKNNLIRVSNILEYATKNKHRERDSKWNQSNSVSLIAPWNKFPSKQ